MSANNRVLQLLITAKDEASAAFGKIFGFLDKTTSATANLIREQFSNLFSGGLTGAAEFEAQLDRVAAKGGYTGSELGELKGAAQQLGAQFGITGTEAAKGMESLAAAGLSAKDAIGALPSVLALAASEQISADAAAQKLVDSLSIMGLGFENAGKMADVLAKGANITTSSASQLAEAISQAGGTARALGMDLEQTVAALDLLHKNGIKGAEAGTALKSILTSLLDPSSKASTELDKLGISSRDLGGVMAALKDKGGAANAAILAFGTEAGPGLRALLAEGQGALDEMTLQLKNADGAAQSAADEMGGNLKSAMASLNSAWDSLKSALLEPLLEPLAKQAKELSASFQEALSGGSIQGVQNLLKEFGTGIAEGIRKAIDAFDFKSATTAITGFAESAKGSFAIVEGAGKAAAGSIQVAFNLITAPIKALVSSVFQTVGNLQELLASVEQQAAKVGLGSVERAEALMRKAQAAKDTAREVMDATKQDVDDLTAGANQTAAAFDGVTEAAHKAKEAVDEIKPPDLSKATALETIKKTIADYTGLLERAKTAQQEAAQAASDAEADYLKAGAAMDRGTGSAFAYEEAAKRNKAAQEALNAANTNVAESQQAVDVATQNAIRGIDQESAAITASLPTKKSRYDAAQSQLKIDQKIAEAQTDLIESLVQNAEQELRNAKAKGDSQAAAEALVKVIQAETEALQAKWIEQQQDLDGLKLKADRIADLQRRQEILTASEAAELELLKQQNPALEQLIETKQVDIDTTAKQIEGQQLAAQQAEIMAGPIGQLQRLYESKTAALKLDTAQTERNYDAQINAAEADERAAIAKSDMVAAAEASLRVKTLEADKSQALANTFSAEAANQISLLEAKKLAVLASDESYEAKAKEIDQINLLIEGQKQGIQQSYAAADAKKAEAAAAEEAAAAQKKLAEETAKAAESAAQQAAAAAAVNSNWDAANRVLAETGGNMEKLNEAFIRNQEASTRNALGWDAWARGTANAADAVVVAFNGQKTAVDNAIAALDAYTQTGQFTVQTQQALYKETDLTRGAFDLLNDADLSNLQDAIDAARGKMDDLRRASEEALAAAREALLQEQGDTAGVLRLQQKQKELELQQRINEAKAAGDRESLNNLQAALALEQKTYDLKLKKAEADSQSNNATAASTRTAASAGAASPERTYALNLTVGQQTLQATTTTDPSSFLNSVAAAKRAAL